jgi:hypothetical protein
VRLGQVRVEEERLRARPAQAPKERLHHHVARRMIATLGDQLLRAETTHDSEIVR